MPLGTAAREIEPGHYVMTGDVTPHLLVQLNLVVRHQDVLASEINVEHRTL